MQNRKAFIFSSIFTVIFYLFEIAAFSQYRNSAVDYFTYALKTDFWLKYIIISTIFWILSTLTLLVFVYLSLISSLVFRVFYFLIFSLTIFFAYGYQIVFERFPIFADLKIALMTTSTQQVDAIFSYFNWLALIPCLVYFLLLLIVNPQNKISQKNSVASLAVLLTSVSLIYLSIFFAAPRIFTYNLYDSSFGNNNRNFYSYLFLKFSPLPDQRQSVQIPEIKSNAPNNIVIIADESTRGDHLSINGYERSTTPFLESLSQQGIIYNWKIASSGSTRSLESFQYLISGITTDDLTDITKKVHQMPTMFQYAKAMGYKTYYFDGQLNEYWGGDPEDLKVIDVVAGVNDINPDHQPDFDNDFKIAQRVNEIISKSPGNFVFIFKHGNHTPYNKNFPATQAMWAPFSSADPPYHLEAFDQKAFVNSYDDGIKYNLDKFFQTIILDYKNIPNSTVLIYTGDHGQTLSENGENYTHGKNTIKEATVPLFIIGDLKTQVDTSFKASHANIFATVLDLINYPENLRNYNYAKSLIKATSADSKDRYFLVPNNGNGLVFDKSLKVKFD